MTAADRQSLLRARLIVGALVGGVLVLTALGGFIPRMDGAHGLVVPAAVVGAASPAIAFRIYQLMRDRLTPDSTVENRREVFVRANVLCFSITEAAAVFGAVVFALSGAPLALIGVGMHVLLAGAVWPSQEKLEAFLSGYDEHR